MILGHAKKLVACNSPWERKRRRRRTAAAAAAAAEEEKEKDEEEDERVFSVDQFVGTCNARASLLLK